MHASESVIPFSGEIQSPESSSNFLAVAEVTLASVSLDEVVGLRLSCGIVDEVGVDVNASVGCSVNRLP